MIKLKKRTMFICDKDCEFYRRVEYPYLSDYCEKYKVNLFSAVISGYNVCDACLKDLGLIMEGREERKAFDKDGNPIKIEKR